MRRTSSGICYLWVNIGADVAKPAADDDFTGDEEEAEISVDDCLAWMGGDARYYGPRKLHIAFQQNSLVDAM